MFKFHFLRSMRDLVGHLILIAFPVLLIAFFDYIFAGNLGNFGMSNSPSPYLTVLTIGFALTFQIYGASVSFEVLGNDFFGPMKDRLLASPTEPRSLVLSTLVAGCLVSFLQTLAVLLFSVFILKATLGSWLLILPIFMLSVVFNQILGTVILFLTKSVKTSNSMLTIYGGIVPMSIGLYFPLPENTFFSLLKNYLSPLALGNSAILGIVEGNSGSFLIGAGSLGLLTLGLYTGLRPLIRRLNL